MAIIQSGDSTDQLHINPDKSADVNVINAVSAAVTNFPATQPISGTVSVSGSIPVTGPLTDTQLRALAVPVSGTVSVGNFPGTQAVSGSVSVSNFPATQPVSGTFFQATQPVSVAASVAVTGPLTDTQLRATPVSVSVSNFPVATEITNDVGNPIPTEGDSTRSTLAGEYTTTTFRIAGLASNPHNLFSIWNPAASGKNLAVRRMTLQCDHTTLLAANLNLVTSHPTAQPTAGTLMTGSKFKSSQAASIAEVRGAASADGTASAITATAGTRIWSQFAQRAQTLAGWFTTDDLFAIPEQCIERPIILAPGEGLLINTVANATTGANYVVNCWWTEYT